MAAGGPTLPRRLFAYNAGFLRQPRLRRILALAGHELCVGLPGPADGVVVWGRSPHAWRGEAVARRYEVPLVRLEDAFLRSIRPGRAGDAPIGLMIDGTGVHFDSAAPSALEHLLATHPLEDFDLLARSRMGMARMQAHHLSKYNVHDPDLPCPPPGYVLVVDQTAGDASIRAGEADAGTFGRMLACAKADYPGARIVIRTHPETAMGLRAGHYGPADADARTSLLTTPVSATALLAGAAAVLTVSSLMGFEAVMAGHRPRVFGQPFYAGWGLTDDEHPVARRTRVLTAPQLFAAAMILAPVWYDPCRGRLCPFEDALDQMEAEVRAFRQDRAGHVASGMRLWKRTRLQAVFGTHRPLIFADPPERALARAAASGRNLLIWAGKAPEGFDRGVEERGVSVETSRQGAQAEGPAFLGPDQTDLWSRPTDGLPTTKAAMPETGETGSSCADVVSGSPIAPRAGPSPGPSPGDARQSLHAMQKPQVSAAPPAPVPTPPPVALRPVRLDPMPPHGKDTRPSSLLPVSPKRDAFMSAADRQNPVIDAALPLASHALSDPAVPPGQDGASRPGPVILRVEDGFLRSRGLGARLVPPLSLVADDLGIYYDPKRESRLERLIAGPLPPGGAARAERLVAALIAAGLSKYNLAGRTLLDLPPGHRILVPGQVEDDASIRAGCGTVRANLGLLQAVRAANPGAVLVYKPHPDVEAGLRAGAIAARDLARLADVVAMEADPLALIVACDEVWTMTSLLGFEALLRGRSVTCLGMPFYAGWGLTRDLYSAPARRSTAPRPGILHLAHAALIAYPRYFDPISRRPCPPEVIVERLASGMLPAPPVSLRWLARAQGRLAGFAHLWR